MPKFGFYSFIQGRNNEVAHNYLTPSGKRVAVTQVAELDNEVEVLKWMENKRKYFNDIMFVGEVTEMVDRYYVCWSH